MEQVGHRNGADLKMESLEISGNSVEIQWKSMEMPVLTSAALCAVEPTFIFRSCNMVLVMATR